MLPRTALGKRFHHNGPAPSQDSGLCSQMRPRERLRLVEPECRVTEAGGWRVRLVQK